MIRFRTRYTSNNRNMAVHYTFFVENIETGYPNSWYGRRKTLPPGPTGCLVPWTKCYEDLITGRIYTSHHVDRKYLEMEGTEHSGYSEHSLESPYSNESVQRRIDDFVAWEWRDLVCTCLVVDYSPKDNRRCRACGKWARWLFSLRCDTCGKSFIHAFRHHVVVRWLGKTCYTCLVTKFGEKEGDHNDEPGEPKFLPSLTELLNTPEFDFDF